MDSQPPTPKSVRPPLPGDVDAELRAACTWIVTHPKPSHEIWETSTSKPALDYRAIKYAEAGPVSSVPALAKRHSIRSREPSKQDLLPDSSKYSYRPNVAAEDLFKPTDVVTKSARSRVEQLMAPEPLKPVPATGSSRQRSESHSHSHSTSAQQHVVRAEIGDKNRASTRSDSIGTSGSTPHTDSTEYPWSASTAMTSAVMTPSRSKRTSSQAISSGLDGGVAQVNKAKADAVNAEWMRLELEKHFRTMDKVQQAEQEEPVVCSATYMPSGTSPRYSRDFTHVPARKPVPSRNSSMQPGRVSRPATGQNIRESSPPLRGRLETTEQEARGRSPPRSYSRIGKASRAASRAASGAASRAGSFANEIFMQLDIRPSQTSSQPAQNTSDVQRSPSKAPSRGISRGPARPPSRARSISRHVKEYFRPGSSVHTRKDSVDSGVTPEDRSERGRGWRVLHRGHSTFDLSRPGSAASRATTGEPQSPRYGKPAVDLNRELPPLPGLDKWESAQTEPEQQSSTLTRALSKMDLAKNAHVARLATGTSRRQPAPGSSASPRSSTFQPQSQDWRHSPSASASKETIGHDSRRQHMPPPQRVPRPQNRGVVPASNRHGFVDPGSDSAASIHQDRLQSSSRSHQRSPTVDGKTKRKWWPSGLKRSPSQAGRMDSLIRPTGSMPMV